MYGDDVRFVLRQDFVTSYAKPTESEIAKNLYELGFENDGRYSYGNDLISITDVMGDNVIYDAEHNIRYIDPIITFKVPAVKAIEELARRYDETGKFARFSVTPAQDAEYMEAVNSGDMDKAKRMVDEVAKANGYERLFYHGAKKGGGFTKFKDWQYFTENRGRFLRQPYRRGACRRASGPRERGWSSRRPG